MKLLPLSLVMMGLLVIMGVSVAQAQDGLVALWALDEESGSTIIDSSPNGLNGTANGTSIIDGVKGKARSFNGSTDFLDVPDNSLLDINDEITIMFWVKTDQAFVLPNAFPISKRVTDGEINYTVVLGQIGGSSVIGFQFGASPAVMYYANTDFYDNQWHHYGVSFQFGNPASARWVIDGNLVSGTWYQGDGSQVPNTNAANLQIGRQLSTSPCYYKGALDQVRIYGDALDETQIHAIYEEEAQTPQETRILLYTTRHYGTGLGVRRWDYDEDLPAILAPDGFTVTAQDRETLPELTSTILADYGQLWFVSTESGHILSSAEVQAIHEFHNAGKAVMIIGDSYTYDGPANQVSEAWGVEFSGQVDHCGGPVGCPLSTAGFEPHDIWNGVSEIQANLNEGDLTASSPAQIIASHNTIGMAAIRDADGGRVAWDATVYRFTDASCHPDVSISHYENAEYVRNLANWLAGGSQPPPDIETQLVMTPVSPTVRTGEAQNFQVTLTDNDGNLLPWKTIDFTWEYSGLEPVENFNGASTRQTDLLGQCNLNWFSKWAAFDGNVTVTMTAAFAGDGEYMPSNFSTSIMVDATPAQIFARVFKDLNGNGAYENTIDQLIANLPLTISSAYNNYTRIVTSTTGEYDVFIPKCAYDLSVMVIDHGVEHPITHHVEVGHFDEGNEVTVEFAYRPPNGSIRGYVFKNGDRDQVVTDASVKFSTLWMEDVVSVVADPTGYYQVDGLIGGQYYGLECCTQTSATQPICQCEIADLEQHLIIQVDFDLTSADVDQTSTCIGTLVSQFGISPELAECGYSVASLAEWIPGGCLVSFPVASCDLVLTVYKVQQQQLPASAAMVAFTAWTYEFFDCTLETLVASNCPLWLAWTLMKSKDAVDKILTLGNCFGVLPPDWQETIIELIARMFQDAMGGVSAIVSCPVSLTVEDAAGQRLMVDDSGTIINEAGFSSVAAKLGDHTMMVYTNNPAFSIIRVTGLPNASESDSFDLVILPFGSSGLPARLSYQGVPTGPAATAIISLASPPNDHALSVDEDGDGTYEMCVPPTTVGHVGSLSGFVTVDGVDSPEGITLDVYDDHGSLLKSLVTGDYGYYFTDRVPDGDHCVTIVTPIGYQADQETKQFTAGYVPASVDFSLTTIEVTPQQRSMGYWKHQVNVYLSGRGKAQENLADMSSYMGLIQEHFNNNLLNPITIFEVPQPATKIDSLEVLRDLLTVNKDGTMNDRAEQQLVALILNVVSLKLHQATPISEDSATASQAITYCSQLITDSEPSNDEVAKDVADCINNGVILPSGTIPSSTPNIAYKGGREQAIQASGLPQEFSLGQNYPNPFNPDCEIRYALPADAEVTLSIYNVLGQKVRTLVEEHQASGQKTVSWDGTDERGNKAASGIYFYRIKAGEFEDTKKMILMK